MCYTSYMQTKLLIIEDDAELRARIQSYFGASYDVCSCNSLTNARETLIGFSPDVAVLDLILPDGNGMELLKSGELSCPTIILTTISDDDDHIDGLDCGAKDYLIKPVSMRVLERHIEARTGRTQSILTSGKLTIDTRRRTVHYGAENIPLTSTEFNILVYLYEHSDDFHTAQSIFNEVYGAMFLQSTAIKMHLSKLRYKLKQCAPNEDFIVTAYGKGYKFIKDVGL